MGGTTLFRELFIGGLLIFSAPSSSAQVERERVAIEYIAPTNPNTSPSSHFSKEIRRRARFPISSSLASDPEAGIERMRRQVKRLV